MTETKKYKRPKKQIIAPVTCKDEAERSDFYSHAKSLGLTFTDWVRRCRGTKVKRTMTTNIQDELRKDIAFLSDIFHAINKLPPSDEQENLLALLAMEVKRKTDAYDSQVQQPRKRRKAD